MSVTGPWMINEKCIQGWRWGPVHSHENFPDLKKNIMEGKILCVTVENNHELQSNLYDVLDQCLITTC